MSVMLAENITIIPILLTVFHRGGYIVALISSAMLIILPNLFPRPDDQIFLSKASQVLMAIIRVSLLVLVISGIFRYHDDLSYLFYVKLGLVALIIYSITHLSVDTSDIKYRQYAVSRFMLIILTGILGLLI